MLITTIFENDFPANSTPSFRYDYIEKLGDGRGYTAGRVGFCTGCGDLVDVVVEYSRIKPGNALAAFLPVLRALARTHSDEVSQLPGFEAAWKAAGADPAMQQAQDLITDRLYFNPAMSMADRLKISLPMGRAIIYDTMVMHGEGTDPDSVGAIANRVPRNGLEEREWLKRFLQERKKVLLNPANHETQKEWSANAARADILLEMLMSGQFDQLDHPLKMNNRYFRGTIP